MKMKIIIHLIIISRLPSGMVATFYYFDNLCRRFLPLILYTMQKIKPLPQTRYIHGSMVSDNIFLFAMDIK